MSTTSISNLAGRKPRPISNAAKGVMAGAILVAIIAFIIGLLGDNPTQAWTALLTNYLFFTQLGIIGIVFGVIANLTNAVWSRPMKRIAEGFSYFLPVSLVLLVVLFFGRYYLWGWMNMQVIIDMIGSSNADSVRAALEGEAAYMVERGYALFLMHDQQLLEGAYLAESKSWWLNEPFFWFRSFFIVIAFNLLAFYYRKTSLRPDLGAIAEESGSKLAGWRGLTDEVTASQRRQVIVAPIIAIVYGLFWTIHTFDMLLSIDWTVPNDMFGGWQMSSGLLLMWCMVHLYTTYYRKSAYLDDYIGRQQYHDLGKLMFGFSIFWTYIMWSQLLPIWYTNMPKETPYLMLRVWYEPWSTLSFTLAAMIWLIPFIVLMPVKSKLNVGISSAIAVLIMLGLWLERYVLATASLSPFEIPLGLIEILMTAGFLGAFVLITTTFINRNPVITLTDPHLKSSEEQAHH